MEYEAQTARELEKELGRHVLCPLALDKSWRSCNWPAVLRNQIKKYNVLDYSENASSFEFKFQRLLSGLQLFYGDLKSDLLTEKTRAVRQRTAEE